ncbi:MULTISPECIES: protein-export chaperone SecB [Sphingomonas]|jgi:preprotein translocase subunit SecB|uniref:Protein-export protein SecB n=1 Tax=Sphingomonas olei TaxID=1886787 RepID=A0ABY2QMC9_9SPHN|nr:MULTISPECIES: protein-export chaperone SecB [Sphingomonas]MDF2604367.1 preprotein translocase subunit SecB [Sphingomonas sp.]THG41448.1 protein-export chaperone SecB [Sphingomonas olei]
MDEQDNGAGIGNQTGQDGALPNGADNAPAVGLLSQYVKDLSFENPNAPAVFQDAQGPEINVQFDIAANQVADDAHEVTLKIEVRAETQGRVTFLVELAYAGLFGVRNVPMDALQPFLLGEAPRLLFPFARRVVADTIRDGGFPPLLLEPIDFNSLYMQQAEQRDAQIASGNFGQA